MYREGGGDECAEREGGGRGVSLVPQTPIRVHAEGLVTSCTTSCSKLQCGATNQIA